MLRKPSLDSVTREFKSVTTEKNSLASDFYFDGVEVTADSAARGMGRSQRGTAAVNHKGPGPLTVVNRPGPLATTG